MCVHTEQMGQAYDPNVNVNSNPNANNNPNANTNSNLNAKFNVNAKTNANTNLFIYLSLSASSLGQCLYALVIIQSNFHILIF